MELRSITKLVDAKPFKPFVIELQNRRRLLLRHPENIHFLPNRTTLWHITVYDEDQDRLVDFHPSAVTSLVKERGNSGR